ncbi:MAG: c-type cytochrome domain-containing protein, partial [Planctomycetaceae bacterium]
MSRTQITMRGWSGSCLLLLCAVLYQPELCGQQVAVVAEEFPGAELRGLLQRHCVVCHGSEEQSGGLRLDVMPVELAEVSVFSVWQHVHDRVQSDEMPPADARESWGAAERDRMLVLHHQ